MTGLAIAKPWIALNQQNIGAVPAQLGVFELGDENETVVHIGYAGGREMFGLRSALDRAINGELNRPTTEAGPVAFRYELTHGYLTRWEELLMVHQALHGRLPVGNADHPHKIGRLTVS
ncbi:MAG: DUF7508 domain-containing protein [Acidimicrobiales bacterium]